MYPLTILGLTYKFTARFMRMLFHCCFKLKKKDSKASKMTPEHQLSHCSLLSQGLHILQLIFTREGNNNVALSYCNSKGKVD